MKQKTLSQVLSEAARDSGLDDREIAEFVQVSQGYFSRFMRRLTEQWAIRMVLFMMATRSVEPLRWMAHRLGYDLARARMPAAEVAQLQARLAELQREGRAAA
ncbi:MAG TPA: hypothetical protein VEA35_13505 [Ramlibacter sp.]|nr:hypothetical protein [Candidatus Limnocylindrales bacterium]HYF43442.1 hypothetical protein [Ramlibacter sp.]